MMASRAWPSLGIPTGQHRHFMIQPGCCQTAKKMNPISAGHGAILESAGAQALEVYSCLKSLFLFWEFHHGKIIYMLYLICAEDMWWHPGINLPHAMNFWTCDLWNSKTVWGILSHRMPDPEKLWLGSGGMEPEAALSSCKLHNHKSISKNQNCSFSS